MDSGVNMFNSFLTRGDIYCLPLITYARSFDPDQDGLKKLILKKKASRRQQKHEKLPSVQRVNSVTSEDSNEFDHPHILIIAFNACAHNMYTPKLGTEAYWIVASVC